MELEDDMSKYDQYKPIIYKIIGAAMRVHQNLNFGLLESIYQEALYWELSQDGVAAETEKELGVYYRNHLLEKKFKMDLVVGDIICELKVVRQLIPEHRAQLCNYLRLTHKPVGLLINFGSHKLIGERWIYDPETNECSIVDVNMVPIDKMYSPEIDFDNLVSPF